MVPNPNLPHIDHVPLLMRSYIEKIMDVKGDGNCGFWVVPVCNSPFSLGLF
jgi:hypothetical protein